MEIYTITGDDLRVFLNEINYPESIHTVRIAIEDGQVKVKVNEYCWTYGLGRAGNY